MDPRKDLSASQYYRVSDAADFMGVSQSLMNKLRVTGGGPTYIKLGRAVRYQPRDLVAWAEARKFKSTSEYGKS